MASFLFAYRAPSNYTPGTPDAVAAWQAFVRDIGAGLVDMGNPVYARGAVGATDDDTVLGGYSLVDADDLDAALALAKGCPLVARGGGVEVGELTVVNERQAT